MLLELSFPRRPRITRTELSTQRRYDSSCGRWSLIEVLRADGSHYWLVVRRGFRGEYVAATTKQRACQSERVGG
jgi:hypothetical protein